MKSRVNDTNKPKKLGRPPVDTQALNVRLPRAIITKIDECRAAERPIITRAAVIRRILEKAL